MICQSWVGCVYVHVCSVLMTCLFSHQYSFVFFSAAVLNLSSTDHQVWFSFNTELFLWIFCLFRNMKFWLCRSKKQELTPWKYEIFVFMNMKPHSVSLAVITHQNFVFFSYRSCNVLLNLCLNISLEEFLWLW